MMGVGKSTLGKIVAKKQDMEFIDTDVVVEEKCSMKISEIFKKKGGYAESAYGNSGGMLSQVMGPDGIPMNIRTRIGGQYIG